MIAYVGVAPDEATDTLTTWSPRPSECRCERNLIADAEGLLTLEASASYAIPVPIRTQDFKHRPRETRCSPKNTAQMLADSLQAVGRGRSHQPTRPTAGIHEPRAARRSP